VETEDQIFRGGGGQENKRAEDRERCAKVRIRWRERGRLRRRAG
jgi:hypothetical protein